MLLIPRQQPAPCTEASQLRAPSSRQNNDSRQAALYGAHFLLLPRQVGRWLWRPPTMRKHEMTHVAGPRGVRGVREKRTGVFCTPGQHNPVTTRR